MPIFPNRFLARLALPLALPLAIAACGNDADVSPEENNAQATAENGAADEMASKDPAPGQAFEGKNPDVARPVMQAQVVLDRLGFSPGVVDGRENLSMRNAVRGFQKAEGLNESGTLDEATRQALAEWSNIRATRIVTIPADFAVGRFETIPDDPAEQAKMQRLGYESLDEKLAERFHTTVEVLKRLNPNGAPAGMEQGRGEVGSPATPTARAGGPAPGGAPTPGAESLFRAGQQIRVPNVGADAIDPGAVENAGWRSTLRMLGIGTKQPDAARIVVDESDKTLTVYDAGDQLVAQFTVSTGSSNDPLPLGAWEINGVAHNPPFEYDPKLFWDVPDSNAEQKLPPGPNGPVGVVWIDLSKEHYGIHGTNAPETIGEAQSHGCVRLTNWDAARLAEMVSGSTKVVFQA